MGVRCKGELCVVRVGVIGTVRVCEAGAMWVYVVSAARVFAMGYDVGVCDLGRWSSGVLRSV